MSYLSDLYGQWRRFPNTIRLFYATDIPFAFCQAIFHTLFNLHLLAMGLNAEHVGVLQSSAAWIMAAIAIPIGLVGDRFGRRGMFVTGSLVFAAPYLVLPWLTDFRQILLAYAICTVGNALMMVNEAPILASEVSGDQRASVFSFMMVNFFLWNTLGISMAGALADWLPHTGRSPYSWPLVLAGIFGLGAGVTRAFLRFKPQPKPVGPPTFSLKLNRTTLILLGLALLSGAYNALFMNFGNVILAERFGFETTTISTVLTIAGVVGFAGSLMVPWTSRRFGDLRGYALVLGLQGLFTLYLGLVEVPPLFLPGFLARAALGTMQMSLWSAFAMGVTPAQDRATINSYVMVGRNVGTALASKLFGIWIAAGTFLLPFSVAAVCAMLTMAVALCAFRQPRVIGSEQQGQHLEQ